jgi:hypothetical protein
MATLGCSRLLPDCLTPPWTVANGKVTCARYRGGGGHTSNPMLPTSRIALLATLVALSAILSGCSSALGPMPDVIPGKAISKDEQQSKVDAMIATGQTHERDAEKQIEQEK